MANPNCTTMVAMPVLKPLHDAAGLRRLVVSTYQAVSGAGLAGVAELEAQLVKTVDRAGALTFDGAAVDFPEPVTFPDVIAHNVLPMAGSLVEDGSGDTTEEQKFRDESRKILGHPGPGGGLHLCPGAGVHRALPVHRGPVRAAGEPRTRPPSSWPGRRGWSSPTYRHPSVPRAGTRRSSGRLRAADASGHQLALFVSGDNLRKGAALNAVQIAEALVATGLVA